MRGTARPATETKTSAREAAIFSRIFTNGTKAMTPELARYVLGLTFGDEDKVRMHELAVKNQEGELS
jgi:hypothetical protein